jgi:hypothetical protein
MYNDLGIYGTPGPVRRHERYNPTSAMRDMEKYDLSIFNLQQSSVDSHAMLVVIRFSMQTYLWIAPNSRKCSI